MATRSDVEITVLDAITHAGRLSDLDGLQGKKLFVQESICDEAVIDSLVSKADVCVHFAAESHNDSSPRQLSSAQRIKSRLFPWVTRSTREQSLELVRIFLFFHAQAKELCYKFPL